MSKHAARIIVQFMAACCGKSARHDEISEEQVSGLKDLPDNAVSLARIHRLLDDLSQKETPEGGIGKKTTVASDDNPADGDEEDVYGGGPEDGIASFLTNTNCAEGDGRASGTAIHSRGRRLAFKHKHARLGSPAQASESAEAERRKYDKERSQERAAIAHQSRAYINLRKANANVWMAALLASDERPTEEQRRFLDRVIARCSEEHAELR